MKEIQLFPKQLQFYNLKDREALLEAGIAYGKSRVASIWLAEQTQKYSNTKWFMVARNYNQLRTAIDQEFEYYLHDVLGLVRGKDYQKTSGSPIVYTWRNGSIIYGVGAHNYDTVFRAGNYSGAWGDEVDFWKTDAVKALRGRIRAFPELIRFTSSPDGFNHVYEDFYENKVGPVINATTYDNPTLSHEYIQSLKKTYSPRLFEQEVLAKRLNLNVGAVYSEFDRSVHVQPCRDILEEKHQMYFFTDYNISHYCGCYMFEDKDTVYVYGEEHLEFQGSRVMAGRVKAMFPKRPVIVMGDSTGNNKRDVAIEKTNYEHFREAGLYTKSYRNPPVQARIISAQSNLYHKRVVIDPSCKTLIRDLELLAWKEDGKDIDKSDITLSHASDAFTYGLYFFKPLMTQRKSKIIPL